MGGRGFAPKEHRTDASKDPQFEELPVSSEVHGEPLPEGVLPDGEAWHPMTLKWWESVRRWPMMANEPDLGWDFLVDTAYLHHRYWSGDLKQAAELRLRAAKYGATPEDRMRLKVKVTNPDAQPANVTTAGVTDMTSRRDRLGA